MDTIRTNAQNNKRQTHRHQNKHLKKNIPTDEVPSNMEKIQELRRNSTPANSFGPWMIAKKITRRRASNQERNPATQTENPKSNYQQTSKEGSRFNVLSGNTEKVQEEEMLTQTDNNESQSIELPQATITTSNESNSRAAEATATESTVSKSGKKRGKDHSGNSHETNLNLKNSDSSLIIQDPIVFNAQPEAKEDKSPMPKRRSKLREHTVVHGNTNMTSQKSKKALFSQQFDYTKSKFSQDMQGIMNNNNVSSLHILDDSTTFDGLGNTPPLPPDPGEPPDESQKAKTRSIDDKNEGQQGNSSPSNP